MCKEGQSPLIHVDQLFPSADVVVTPIIKGTANLCADGHACAIGHGREGRLRNTGDTGPGGSRKH